MSYKPIIFLTTMALLAALCAADNDCTPGEKTCYDCYTKQICTLFGPILSRCWIPGFLHCSDGKCGTEPSDECRSPPPTEPTSTTEPPTSTTSTTAVPTTEPAAITTVSINPDSPSTTNIPSTVHSTTEGLSTTGIPSTT